MDGVVSIYDQAKAIAERSGFDYAHVLAKLISLQQTVPELLADGRVTPEWFESTEADSEALHLSSTRQVTRR